VPTLVIAGEFDTWSFPADREGLMRDLTNAPAKKSVLIKNATHFVLFEKPRFEFFEAIDAFLKESGPTASSSTGSSPTASPR
jgi:pimeloyl-ACP methyl ester carboxylesterase